MLLSNSATSSRCTDRPCMHAKAAAPAAARMPRRRHQLAELPSTVPAAVRRPGRASLRVCASAAAQPPADDADNAAGAGSVPGALPHAYSPFSAELLLAVARLGHLERYREEVAQAYVPGGGMDLTRCGMLITNIYDPQRDHRPYFERLEALIADTTLATIQLFASSHGNAGASAGGFSGLDVGVPSHLLTAVRAINEVLLAQEGLVVNDADPFDPLNGSLGDVLDSKRGNQYSLALVYLHVAAGMGLPCGVVGCREHTLVRIGDPNSGGPAFLVDLASGGTVYRWRSGTANAAGNSAASSSSSSSCASAPDPLDQAGDVSDDWHVALRRRLLQQQQDGDSSSGSACMDADGPGAAGSSDLGSDEADSLLGWQEVGSYASADAASRNSWKALYGPGALAEWGGSVSSSGRDGGRHARDKGTGILESPFAVAAAMPFAGEGAEGAGGGAAPVQQQLASDSMDTCWGSGSDEDVDDGAASSSSSSSVSKDGAAASPWHAVSELSDEQLVRFGGLQPVSGRVLLQQMLSGMKLALTMSGRNEEALLVLRHLRATDPMSLVDLRDEALVLLALERPEEAAPLLREYLAVAPGAPDADMVGEVLLQAGVMAELARARAARRQDKQEGI